MVEIRYRNLWNEKDLDYDELMSMFIKSDGSSNMSRVIKYLRFDLGYGEEEIRRYLGIKRQWVNNVCKDESIKDLWKGEFERYRKGKDKSDK